MGESKWEAAAKAKYRSEWWTRYFDGEYAYWWPPALDSSDPDSDNYRWISRDDVFSIAATHSEHREIHTAVAAYVWGVGKSVFQVGRLVRAFTRNRDTAVDNLRFAAQTLASDGPVAAYEVLHRGGSARLPYMGPAFFTKFLFFTGYRNDALNLRPLILDKRVATSLRNRGVFGPRVRDGDWSSEFYGSYLAYCHELSPSDPSAVEIELFDEGRL